MPTTLVGTQVDGKPNYIAIAHVGVMALRRRPEARSESIGERAGKAWDVGKELQ
jgi:hypothetical protein